MNRSNQSKHKQQKLVGDEILQYLVKNPNAQDGVTGISDWWLLMKYKNALVKEALQKLVAEGFILEEKISGSQTYKLNHKRLKEIISRLQHRS
jgi:hypothetical protein